MSAEPLPEAFAKAVDLFTYELKLLGHEDLQAYPGIFSVQVDDLWEIATHAQAGPIDRLPPYTIRIRFNGWPAGVLDAGGGVITAVAAANENTFIAALDAALAARSLSED